MTLVGKVTIDDQNVVNGIHSDASQTLGCPRILQLRVRPCYFTNGRHITVAGAGKDQDIVLFRDEYLIIDRVNPDTKVRAHKLRMGTLYDSNRSLFAIGSAPEEQDGLCLPRLRMQQIALI